MCERNARKEAGVGSSRGAGSDNSESSKWCVLVLVSGGGSGRAESGGEKREEGGPREFLGKVAQLVVPSRVGQKGEERRGPPCACVRGKKREEEGEREE